MRNGDFTYDSLVQMYIDLLQKYKVVSFSEGLISRECSLLVIRHDIDIMPGRALRMGLIEKDLGIKSAYFFMTDNPIYNIFSDQTQYVMQKLREYGHEIGLHYDRASELLGGKTDIHTVKEILQSRLSYQFDLISFHKPDQDTSKEKYLFGMLNVFSEYLLKKFKYFSDSYGEWRFGHPLQSEEFDLEKHLYLNLHPEWWTEDVESVDEIKFGLLRDIHQDVIGYWDRDIIPVEAAK